MLCRICPVLCGMFSCLSGLYLLDISSTPSPPTTPFSSCHNQKCPQTLPNVLKEANSPLVENHCYVHVRASITGPETTPRFSLVVWEVVEPPLKTGGKERDPHAGWCRQNGLRPCPHQNWLMRFPIIFKCRFADWERE